MKNVGTNIPTIHATTYDTTKSQQFFVLWLHVPAMALMYQNFGKVLSFQKQIKIKFFFDPSIVSERSCALIYGREATGGIGEISLPKS